ncbi:hypothetical protein ACEWY4_009484 [Coilia grayii]|uniref:HSF-type DNA-binding domain-containing protein n=1 Tax=Coilia grayii TaxID=363190 RepID=A0ABD1K6L8_9TELE
MKQTCQVPAFLSKLWTLAGDESTNDLIRWSHDGCSFLVLDELRFSKEVLPLYFKHSNMTSFIRQLNMYGFHKVARLDGLPTDGESHGVEFQHQYFQRSQAHLLPLIRRKVSLSRVTEDAGQMSQVRVEVSQVGRWCSSFQLSLVALCRDNERLWREMDALRQKYQHQHQIMKKIIHFIASTVQSNRLHGMKRKLSMIGSKGQASSPASKFKRSLSVHSTRSSSYLDSKDSVYSILSDIASLLQPASNLSGLSVSLEIPSALAEDLCVSPSMSLLSTDVSSGSTDILSHTRETPSVLTEIPSSSSSSPSIPSQSTEVLPMFSEVPFLAATVPSLSEDFPVPFSAVPCSGSSGFMTSLSAEVPSGVRNVLSLHSEEPCVFPEELNGSAGVTVLSGECSRMSCDVPPVLSVARSVPSLSPDIPSVFPGVPSGSTSVPSVDMSVPSLLVDIPSMFPGVPSGSTSVPSVDTSVPSLLVDIPQEIPSVFPAVPSEAAGLSSVEQALSLLMEPATQTHVENITERYGCVSVCMCVRLTSQGGTSV